MAVFVALSIGWRLAGFSSATGKFVLVSWRNADQRLERRRIDRFAFEQFFCYQFHLLAMLHENLFGFGIRLSEDFFDLRVDELRGLLAAIALECAIRARQEHSIVLLGATRQADRVAHAKEANHLPSQRGGMLEIIFRSGSYFVENHLLRRPAAEHPSNPIEQL